MEISLINKLLYSMEVLLAIEQLKRTLKGSKKRQERILDSRQLVLVLLFVVADSS